MSQPVADGLVEVTVGRSGCAFDLASELLGGHWSFVVLRDIMFGGRTCFRDVLANSIEAHRWTDAAASNSSVAIARL